ncbi:MAG: DUF4129 domain-containing protein, partial [Anaerolineales bacterium]|nr:DUF4129 domain-containing protein [Anaerolineales bacterium]
YFLAILLVAFVWGLSLMFGEDLMELEGDSSLLEAESLEGLESNREAVQRRLATRLLVIGGGLVFAASFVRLDLTAIGGGAPDSRASILHVLVYFVFGLGLLSLTHLATRRAAWAWEHIPVGPEITRRWMIFSLIFLALVALVAFLLPTGYTLGFLPSISYLVGVVLAVIYGLAMLLLLPVFYVFAWLISLLGFSAPDMPVAQPIEQVLPEVLTAAETQPIAWFEALKSILFWAVIVFVIGMAFRLYLLQNQELVRKLQRIPGLAWLVRAWHWILGRARAGSSAVPKAVREGLKRLRALRRKVPLPEMGHLLRPRQLSPRQQVIFYYLALVRRGSEAVVARKPVDTPYEYAQKLHGGLSGAEQDVDALTEAFVEARYSNHLVQENQISLVREAWEHLRAILHRVRDEKHRSE